MPKMVCSKCEQELRPSTNGVHVVEYAYFGPYKLWQADEWVCPVCGIKVTAGFANHPYRQHFEMGFDEKLEQVDGRLLRRDFESQAQREFFNEEIDQ